jgi:hypothetical protein
MQARLAGLLPALRAGQEALEAEKAQGRLGERDIEGVGEDGPYIEMVRAVGV